MDSFYESDAWKRVRYTALRSNDGKCEVCGRNKKDGVKLHVDHIKPRSLYPSLELDVNNLQILCADCNLGKSNTDCIDWRAKPKSLTHHFNKTINYASFHLDYNDLSKSQRRKLKKKEKRRMNRLNRMKKQHRANDPRYCRSISSAPFRPKVVVRRKDEKQIVVVNYVQGMQ